MTFPEFITTLRQADEQATKGPWEAINHCDSQGVLPAVRVKQGNQIAPHILKEADADAIALLRNSLPQTIAIMEVARKAIEDALHTDGCAIHSTPFTKTPCNCWKANALASMDALAAKTL